MKFGFVVCFFMLMVAVLVTAGVLIYVFLIKDQKKSSENNKPQSINQPLYYYPSSVQQQPVTSYYQATPYSSVNYYDEYNIKGIYGEYSCFSQLKGFEQTGARFIANVYVPKNGTETTEIDLVMICQYGLFVIESKNFGGWIFGDENQTNWTQTLPNRWTGTQKQHFYNPIKQNRGHIKHLCNYLSECIPIYSIIVFSDDCTLKSIKVTSSDVAVVYESNLFRAVNWVCSSTRPVLSQDDIVRIYNKLYPLSQVNMAVRQQHVANIQRRFDNTKR